MNVTINLNDTVWVQLTEAGQKLLWEKSVPGATHSTHMEPDGSVRFLVWELMDIFGSATIIGNNTPPFVGNNLIVKICDFRGCAGIAAHTRTTKGQQVMHLCDKHHLEVEDKLREWAMGGFTAGEIVEWKRNNPGVL